MLTRYKKIMSAESGCRDQMLARHDGQWVKYSEAQSEIARLQAEVDRLSSAACDGLNAFASILAFVDSDIEVSLGDDFVGNFNIVARAIRDTAHNAAIEAAANLDGIEGYSNCVPRHLIRALKRPTQEQTK